MNTTNRMGDRAIPCNKEMRAGSPLSPERKDTSCNNGNTKSGTARESERRKKDGPGISHFALWARPGRSSWSVISIGGIHKQGNRCLNPFPHVCNEIREDICNTRRSAFIMPTKINMATLQSSPCPRNLLLPLP